MEIVRATEKLAPGIASVANSMAYSSLSEREKREFGFLLPYTEKEYAGFAQHADHFYVLCDKDKVIGFVLAHSSSQIDQYGGEVYLHIKTAQTQPFFVIRQICVDKDRYHKGYGRTLYEYLFERLARDTTQDCQAIGFIWKQPPNRPSEEFHKKLGFKELGVYALKDGERVTGIWARTIRPTAV
jgi:predicted GNAT superfamily acetyltransferase